MTFARNRDLNCASYYLVSDAMECHAALHDLTNFIARPNLWLGNGLGMHLVC